jgi:hypothetical protein
MVVFSFHQAAEKTPDAQSVAFFASEPMTKRTDLELRRWHGRVVVGILLAGSAAFALVFWVTVWGTFR